MLLLQIRSTFSYVSDRNDLRRALYRKSNATVTLQTVGVRLKLRFASAFLELWRVKFSAGNLDKVPQVLVECLPASDQRLPIRQYGHGFADA